MSMEWKNLLETDTKKSGTQGINNKNWRYLNQLLGSVDWDALAGITKVYESNRLIGEKNRKHWDAKDAQFEKQIKELFDANDKLVRANEKANLSLESLTGSWENNVANMESDYITKLEASQSGWDKEKASLIEQAKADAAGWESRVKAWDQQTADWSTAFAQQQLKHETDLSAALKKQEDQHLSQLATTGQQTQAQLDEWHKTAAQDRQEFADQLEASGIEHGRQMDELKASFAKAQEAQRLLDIEERGHLESQMQDFYTKQWGAQQEDLTNKYQKLLGDATSDIEEQRLLQAQQFDQMQLDQSAAWADQAQKIANKERVYDDRLAEIKGELGVQEGLYAGVSQRIEDQQSYNKAERAALEQQLGLKLETQAGESEAARAELSKDFGGQLLSAKEDWSESLTDVTTQFQGKQALMEAAIKRNTELGIQNAERARVSASYGRQGHPMNQEVQGVRTLNERTPDAKMYGSATGAFNREGLRIKNLNR